MCFDSILVRLKEKHHNPDIEILKVFRFHTGSIKRKPDHHNRLMPDPGFDSILVRLKEKS